jgi:competence protein ComGC
MTLPANSRHAVALLCLFAVALSAAPAATAGDAGRVLGRVVGAFPGKAEAAAYLKIDQAGADLLFDALPQGELYRKAIQDQSVEFEARTGLLPLRDVTAVALAMQPPAPGRASASLLFFVEFKADPARLLAALQKDAALPGSSLEMKGKDAGTIDQMAFKFVKGGLFFGEPALVDKLAEPPAGGEDSPLGLEGPAAVEGEPRLVAVGMAPNRGAATAGPLALLGKVRVVALALDALALGMRVTFTDAQSAKEAAAQLSGMIASVSQAMTQTVEQEAKQDTSLLGLLSPTRLRGQISSQWLAKLAEQVKPAAKGSAVNFAIPREQLPALGTGVAFGALGVMAAVAVPNFRAAKDKAQRRACFANQKVLMGASEMYNMDHGTQLKTLDAKALAELVDKGYLKSIPEDPGQGEGSSGHYSFQEDGSVKCSVHGGVDEPAPQVEEAAPSQQVPGLGGLLQKALEGATGR